MERVQGEESAQDKGLSKIIGDEIKKQIMVTPKVELVDYGSLPRSERKTKRVFDHREV